MIKVLEMVFQGFSKARRGFVMASACLLIWTLASTASDSTISALHIHAKGLGPLVVGMTVREARALPGVQLDQTGPQPVPDTFCTYYRVRISDQEVKARVIKDRIDRIEVSSPKFSTVGGIRIGDSIDRVKVVYGKKVSIEPHHYLWDQGVVLMVLGPYGNQQNGYGVAFTASPEKGVTEIWVGWYQGIRESEGCS